MFLADYEGMCGSGGTPPFILNLGPFMEASGSFHAAVALPPAGDNPLSRRPRGFAEANWKFLVCENGGRWP